MRDVHAFGAGCFDGPDTDTAEVAGPGFAMWSRGVAGHFGPSSRQGKTGGITVDRCLAQMLLQRQNARRDGRPCQTQPFRRLAPVLDLAQPVEGFEVPYIHCLSGTPPTHEEHS